MDSPVKKEATLIIWDSSPSSVVIFIVLLDIVVDLLDKIGKFPDLREERANVFVDGIMSELFCDRPDGRRG